ncbi:hypothetical protein LRF89_06080 [Halorhodospira sp. 9621]|uniref:hypothetical protein n=1 Tax=Halorhodospira sp. 9621 TaxID=2899135 RepID=UPI001EE96A7C|nr:hypothetical protein [Halorhodospira sp. 9621]MCG5533010.1 hypothetical protein [Halorhodospira sp. 9621]
MSEGSSQSFPRVRHIQIGYSPAEDRVLLRLAMVTGEQRSAWIPRRVMGRLMARLNEALKRSHPAGEGQPAADAVMAMEHVAARSELAGQRQGSEEGPQQEPGAHERTDAQPVEDGAYLITQERIDIQQGQVLVGLLGHDLPSAPGLAQTPRPVGALSLSRTQAHELLRMLTAQAEQAQWGLGRSVSWLRWLKSRRERGQG